MDEHLRALAEFYSEHANHESHLPVMCEVQEEIYEECKKLPITDSAHLKYLALRIQCDYFLRSIFEMTKSLVLSLKCGCYSSAEALARISVEHSINLIFVLEGEEHSRAKSLLKSYLIESRRKAEKWRSFGEKHGDEGVVERADAKMAYLDEMRKANPDLFKKRIKGWPDARARFQQVGLESIYHSIFASASDSVHSLSEDVFNLMVIESGPEEGKSYGISGFVSEKRSFAYYLSGCAILLFAEAAVRLATELDEHEIAERITQSASRVSEVINEHEELSDKYHQLTKNSIGAH